MPVGGISQGTGKGNPDSGVSFFLSLCFVMIIYIVLSCRVWALQFNLPQVSRVNMLPQFYNMEQAQRQSDQFLCLHMGACMCVHFPEEYALYRICATIFVAEYPLTCDIL